MNTHDEIRIRDEQCRTCGSPIAAGEGVYDNPEGDDLGDAAYNHKNCASYHENCLE